MRGKKKRERFVKYNIYDTLVEMQMNLEEAQKHKTKACIMNALGEINAHARCELFTDCEECIRKWMNEEEL